MDPCSRTYHLPGPQRDALGIAFGLSAGASPNRFLRGLALLSHLAVVAEERPSICLVDDAQWLDRVSAQVLGVVARRLMAESVGLVFAVRASEDDEPASEGLPELNLRGLNDRDARSLLDSVTPGWIDEGIRSRSLAEARGSPLALLELPRGSSVADPAGGLAQPGAQPSASHIEQSFLSRVQSLPPATRRLLLIAAAEPVRDVDLLTRAAERLGIGVDAASPAQTAGLLTLGTSVLFRHPLLRAAAYRAAALAGRKEFRWQGVDRRVVLSPWALVRTTTDRLAINVVQSAWRRRESCVGPWLPEPVDSHATPEAAAEQQNAVEGAVLLTMETLTPTQRAAYLLREGFGYPYVQISELLCISVAKTRQQVSRAHQRVAAGRRRPSVDAIARRRLVEAFFTAARSGDVEHLARILAAGAGEQLRSGESGAVRRTRLPSAP